MRRRSQDYSPAVRAGSTALALRGLACIAFVAGFPDGARAAGLSGAAGFHHFSGPFEQTTMSGFGVVALSAARGDLSLAGTKFDDGVVGDGWSGTLGVGIALGGAVMLRAFGTRSFAEDGFRSWRVRTGPEFRLAGGRALGLHLEHHEDSGGAASNGATAELVAPLHSRLAARLSGGIASTRSGRGGVRRPGAAGTVGLAWTAVRRLEVVGEAGLARNGTGAYPGGASPGGLLGGHPLVGGPDAGDADASENRVDRIAGIGVRVFLP